MGDMNDLVYKVHDDVGSSNPKIEQELAEKMLSKEKYHQMHHMHHAEDEEEEEKDYEEVQGQGHKVNGYMLSQKMSVSLARDAPQVSIGGKSVKLAKSVSPFGYNSDPSKYHRMSVDNDDSDDNEHSRSRTRKPSRHRHPSLSTMLSSKMKSSEYTESVNKQLTVDADDIWLNKVMHDLKNGDDSYYDYSENDSYKSYKF